MRHHAAVRARDEESVRRLAGREFLKASGIFRQQSFAEFDDSLQETLQAVFGHSNDLDLWRRRKTPKLTSFADSAHIVSQLACAAIQSNDADRYAAPDDTYWTNERHIIPRHRSF